MAAAAVRLVTVELLCEQTLADLADAFYCLVRLRAERASTNRFRCLKYVSVNRFVCNACAPDERRPVGIAGLVFFALFVASSLLSRVSSATFAARAQSQPDVIHRRPLLRRSAGMAAAVQVVGELTRRRVSTKMQYHIQNHCS